MLAARSFARALHVACVASVPASRTTLQQLARPLFAPKVMGQAASLLPGVRRGGKHLSTTSPLAAKKSASAAADRPQESDPDLWIVVGLGNPGPRYEDTRHNVGFMVIDALARQESIAVDRLQENAAVGRGRFCDKKVLLAKPMTFMNNSGESVGRLARFYRVPAERILVIYDDLDLPTAKVRLRAKGGHGGHNGMKSITSHLQGSKDFPRIKVGIGRPEGAQSVASYVLQDFSKAEREEVRVAVAESIDLIRAVFTQGMERAVSGVKHDQQPKPKKPKAPRQPRQPAAAAAEGQGEAQGEAMAVEGQQQQQQQGEGQQPMEEEQLPAKQAATVA